MKRTTLLLALLPALTLASPVLAAGPAPDAAPPAAAVEAAATSSTAPVDEALPFLTPEPLFASTSTCVSCTTHAQCQALCGGPAGCLRDFALECGGSTTLKYCTCF